jgi:septum formation protein
MTKAILTCRFFYDTTGLMNFLKPLVLASASPRRISLLQQLGLAVEVRPSHVPEDFDSGMTPVENATLLALRKAREISRGVRRGIVIGADTIVTIDGELLAKPETQAEAVSMLQRLSGRTHTVVTGFALVDCPSGLSVTDAESTSVTFRVLPSEEIKEYVAGGSPMDKAGAYGIQDDYGAVFVTRIEGCFYNVVGFPLARFYMRLREFQSYLAEQEGTADGQEDTRPDSKSGA